MKIVKRMSMLLRRNGLHGSISRRALREKIPAMALLSMVLALCAGDATGQQKSLKDELVGAWKFVSSTSQRDDGSATWGQNPKGLLIFTDSNRFSLQIMRSDRPRYKSNTRMRGSLIENQATTRGTLSYFGTYAVSEPNRMLTFHIESSSFPNLNDTDQKRVLTLASDDLKLENPTPSRGSGATVQVWQRVK
ncbi:MAG: lipocalin-like domain-containing protein [Xanthobacteraceae bacterium]